MDLRQNKLSKSEWESIEVPSSSEETWENKARADQKEKYITYAM